MKTFQIILTLVTVFYRNANAKNYHVIGAGLGRTGTLTLKTALEKIGFGRVFHMEDNGKCPHLAPLWKELADLTPVTVVKKSYQNGTKMRSVPEWPPVYDDKYQQNRVEILSRIVGLNQSYWREQGQNHFFYRSVVDFPTCMFYRDLIDVYTPQKSKVILSIRENGGKWAKSAYNSIFRGHPSRQKFGFKMFFIVTPLRWVRDMMRDVILRFLPDILIDEDMEYLASFHDDWNEDVRNVMKKYSKDHSIPLENIFLEFQAKDGWGPLCKFLEVEDFPTEAFPHVNDTKRVQNVFELINIAGYFLVGVLALSGIFILKLFVRLLVGNYINVKVKKI